MAIVPTVSPLAPGETAGHALFDDPRGLRAGDEVLLVACEGKVAQQLYGDLDGPNGPAAIEHGWLRASWRPLRPTVRQACAGMDSER
jgi:hypothetical protein